MCAELYLYVMKGVALISGGKDSIAALHLARLWGIDVTELLHLTPKNGLEETDSFMYQSVGTEGVSEIFKYVKIPLVTWAIRGDSVDTTLNYTDKKLHDCDEVEDLFLALKQCKNRHPELKAVLSGALESSYQKNRVEDCCRRLNLISVAPLWKVEEYTYMCFLLSSLHIDFRIIKVAAYGLQENALEAFSEGALLETLLHAVRYVSVKIFLETEGTNKHLRRGRRVRISCLIMSNVW